MKSESWRKRIRAHGRAEAARVQADPERRRKRNLRQREHEARRRAQILRTRTRRISYERLIATYGMVCNICKLPIEEGQLSFDHVVPLVRGGSHTEDNLRPAHLNCNRRKNRRLMEEL